MSVPPVPSSASISDFADVADRHTTFSAVCVVGDFGALHSQHLTDQRMESCWHAACLSGKNFDNHSINSAQPKRASPGKGRRSSSPDDSSGRMEERSDV